MRGIRSSCGLEENVNHILSADTIITQVTTDDS